MNILLIEDDLGLGNGVRLALQDQGMELVWVRRLAEAKQLIGERNVDVVLLDLNLPDGDGIDFLRDLRAAGEQVPVLVLTARDALPDRLRGLDQGADDYLVKPFALAELISRVRALWRRRHGMPFERLEVRALHVYPLARRVTVGGEEVVLSPSEFEILLCLVKRLDRVVTRRILEERLAPSAEGGSNVLDVHISNLRKKIGEGYIRTVRGVGYVIDRVPARRGGVQ